METVRLLIDSPLDGPANMGRDEALLAAVGRRDTPPTLRFYAWRPATISLGYFQEYSEYQRLHPPAGGLPIVRRTTGGGAILHDAELTYSLAIPVGHSWLQRGPNALYELMHRAIIRAVGSNARLAGCDGIAGVACDQSSQRGPFFCFARRHAFDVVVPGGGLDLGWSKLAGSAQRRTRDAVLQHGSLILQAHYPQQPCAAWATLGGPSDFSEAAQRITAVLRSEEIADPQPGAWTSHELRLADELVAKYAGAAWTRQR